jgi:hypothetical protein
VDREIAAVAQEAQHLVRHPAEADLQGRSVVDEPRDVARDLLGDARGGFVHVLHDRRVHRHERGDPLRRDPPATMDPRLVGVHLGNHRAGGLHRGQGDVDGNPQAAHAVLVGWGDLDERDVERKQPAPEHRRHVGQ